MKIIIAGPFKNNIYNTMRDLGYHFQQEIESSKEIAFTRPRQGYPRFHLFIKTTNDSWQLSLHLDQKKPVYEGTTAHSGDYDEPVVKQEMARIQRTIEHPLY